MYTISMQKAKIVARSWKEGLTQPLERLEKRNTEGHRETKQKLLMMSSPKPVFNGKNRYVGNNGRVTPEVNQAGHEENVRFIADAWYNIQHEIEMARKNNREGPEFYQDKRVPSQSLRNIKPIDIELWRERRLLERNLPQ